MADEQNPNNDTPPPAPPAPATPAAPVVTPEVQALINQAAQAAHNAAWKQARETFEAKQKPGAQPPPATTKTEPPPQPPPLTDVRAEINRIRSFERAVGQFGLSPAALDLLESDFNTANPQDPAGWVKQRAEAFGWKAPGQPSTPAATVAATTPPGTVAPTGPHITERPTPPAPHVVTEDTPILSLSVSDRDALRAKLGDVAYAERFRRELKEKQVRIRRLA
jgi:hypothetical protein